MGYAVASKGCPLTPFLAQPTFRQFFNLLEYERGLIALARILVAATHLRKRRVALLCCRIPMDPMPMRSQELAKRVPGRKTDAHAVRSRLLDRWGRKLCT